MTIDGDRRRLNYISRNGEVIDAWDILICKMWLHRKVGELLVKLLDAPIIS